MRRRNFIQESELKKYENGIIFHRAIYHIQLWSDDRCGNPGMHCYGNVPAKKRGMSDDAVLTIAIIGVLSGLSEQNCFM